MNLRSISVATAAAVGLAMVSLLPGSAAGNGTSLLSRPVAEFSALDLTVEETVGRLANTARFRAGVESADVLTRAAESPRRIRVQMRNANVRTILDAVIRADDRYTWAEADDFINVMPKEAKTDPDYPLNARIEDFEANHVPLTECVQRLFAAPAISRFNPTVPSWQAWRPPVDEQPRITLAERNATWRGLMNQIALQAAEGVGWTARRVALTPSPPEVQIEIVRDYGPEVTPPLGQPQPKMLPFRRTMEQLGAAVSWDPSNRSAAATVGDYSIRVWVGSTLAAFGKPSEPRQEFNLPATTELRGDRVWVAEQVALVARNTARNP